MAKLSCRACQKSLNATSDNFPLTAHEKRTNKKGEVKDFIVGYICKYCVRVEMKRRQAEQPKIKIPKESTDVAENSPGVVSKE